MKVVVSGTSGFVGSNLINYCGSDVLIKPLNRTDWTQFTADFLNDADAVVHLSGKAHDLRKVSSPHEYYDVNFELTRKLYDGFIKSDATKFLFISSVKAVADSVDNVLMEETAPNPQTHYGKSKLMAEQYIQSQPLPPGKAYYILRPCMIHGPGNKGNLNLLYQFVKKSIPYPLAAFKNRRSFLTVENLCFVISEIINRNDILSGVYNISDDEPLSTNEVIAILSSSLSKKPGFWSIPTGVIRFIAKVGDLLRLPLTSERLQKLTENYIVSNRKIKNALGKNLPLTATQGMLLTAQSFKK